MQRPEYKFCATLHVADWCASGVPQMRAAAAANLGTAASGSEPKDEDELGVAVSLSVGELPIEHYERLFRCGGAGGVRLTLLCRLGVVVCRRTYV